MANKLIWFKFDPRDWLTDTQLWSHEAKGVMIDLMSYQAINGHIPADKREIAKLIGRRTEVVVKLFETYFRLKFELINGSTEDKLVNRRLHRELQKVTGEQDNRSRGGKQSAVKRQSNGSQTSGTKEVDREIDVDKEKRENARVPETEDQIMKRIEAKIDPMEKEAIKVCGSIQDYLNTKGVVIVNTTNSVSPIKACLESGITHLQIYTVYRMIFEDPAPSKDTVFHKGKLGSSRFGYHLKDRWGELYAKVEGEVGNNQSALIEARYGK